MERGDGDAGGGCCTHRERTPPQMVNAEFLKSVPTHQGLPLPRATLPDRAAVPHLSPCAHDPKLTETREIAPYVWVHPDEERVGFSLSLSLSSL